MKIPYGIYKTLCLAIFSATTVILSSCDSTDDEAYETTAEQTILMFMPWSGNGIYTYFLDNISAFENAIKKNKGLKGNRLLVFISKNSTESNLIDITYKGNKCVRDTLVRYISATPRYTTADGIRLLLAQVVAEAPARCYSMIIGSHGMGWIPVGTDVTNNTGRNNIKRRDDTPLTRYFGHSSDNSRKINITTLAEGIKSAGLKMEYILFDNCYMSNIETAYDLKDATKYMIASTSEIMITGMPYDIIGDKLLTKDLKGVCELFHSFYSTYSDPYGTIALIDCRELGITAAIMKDINASNAGNNVDMDGIQALDGLSPTIFFDFGDYVNHICKNTDLLSTFNSQMSRLVPFKAHTQYYYSDYTRKTYKINTFSGLTTSAPTTHNKAAEARKSTAWYIATH